MESKTLGIFHLAIPTRDIEESVLFYEKLKAKVCRRYEDRATFDFFGAQLVCHLSPEHIDKNPKMYPRHFGQTFTDLEAYEELLASCLNQDLTFFAKPFTRFSGQREEHRSFMILDPSNNILEFKFYKNEEMIY